ncbi:hypothetical protein KUTeg_016938 [Tegillarca granosa]|uniref:SH3 domain-containing protein n=1 Tax=Tegillarca granosa TaxID=220873 RepID=A0ABQ9EMC1_TEGGR|nr:hypothetical protein KUTeg_016938 [Tegillarca granosa]
MQKYVGALNFREKIGSSISPCGSFVFAGSEDNCVYAWNTETGDQVAMYSELNFRHPVTDVVYHPRDHMFAACSLGDNQPVVIYHYDPHVAQKDAGLSPRQIIPESQEYQELGGTSPISSPRKMEETASGRVMTKDEFNVQTTSRLEKVMKKLNTATIQMATMPSMDLPGVVDSPSIAHTGYLANFDSSLTPRSMMATPQQFTPHAPRTMTGIMHQQQFASQNIYLKSSDSDWRPGFSEVGRYGARSASPTFIGRPPHLSLTASHGKAQFSFQAPAGKAVPHYKQVVALYDYRAQRSDELTIFKGDVISVLYKDNDNWWMGELPDGQQGFFPSNYVAEEGEYDEDQLRLDSGRTLDDDSADDTPKKTVNRCYIWGRSKF